MADPDLNHIRNIGIAAHIDAGKTTLTERVLYYTGALHRIGEVHEGNTHTDYMPEEQAHGITIGTAVTRCPWKDHLIQVVDTPGHVDFTIEVERAMRVLDGAVIVMDGVRGVEPQTETVWRQASRFSIPRLIFVNKMDRPGASYDRAMETLTRKLGAHPVPVCVPLENDLAVLDLIHERLYRFSGEKGETVSTHPVPEEHADVFARHRESLLLAVAEANPELEEAVLEGHPIAPEAIVAALRQATIDGKAHPVFGGSALRNWGVQPLLDGVLALLPAPLDRPQILAKTLEGEERLLSISPKGKTVALAFKVQMWEGRRHVFARIYRGKLAAGQKILLAGKGTEERIARVFDVDADTKKRIEEAGAGAIVLLAGLRHATTGDTLCDPDEPLLLESIEAREPVVGLAIEPESTRDEAKLFETIGKMCEEDPTLRFEEDPDTGQRILSGMGELHLQIYFERIERETGIKVRAGKPRVMTRETIGGAGSASAMVDRQMKIGENKEIVLKARAAAAVRPLERNAGIEKTVKPAILPAGVALTPAQEEAVRLGVSDALAGGPVEGAPLQDVAVTLTEVEVYGEASTPQALRIAASQAVREALTKAGGQVLRPLMKIEVVVPDESVGAAMGDLQSRRATITGQESEYGTTTILGECSLGELLGYTMDLRSLTRGRGQFTMEFSRFDVA